MAEEPDLTGLPEDRRKAVTEWLASTLWICDICGQPVRPVDARVPVKQTTEQEDADEHPLRHLDCSADNG